MEKLDIFGVVHKIGANVDPRGGKECWNDCRAKPSPPHDRRRAVGTSDALSSDCGRKRGSYNPAGQWNHCPRKKPSRFFPTWSTEHGDETADDYDVDQYDCP